MLCALNLLMKINNLYFLHFIHLGPSLRCKLGKTPRMHVAKYHNSGAPMVAFQKGMQDKKFPKHVKHVSSPVCLQASSGRKRGDDNITISPFNNGWGQFFLFSNNFFFIFINIIPNFIIVEM